MNSITTTNYAPQFIYEKLYNTYCTKKFITNRIYIDVTHRIHIDQTNCLYTYIIKLLTTVQTKHNLILI